MYSVQDLPKEGFPHSDIRGSTIARISPRLIAACHVLHRLLAPRHPLNALLILTISVTARTQDPSAPTGANFASHVQSDSNATPRHPTPRMVSRGAYTRYHQIQIHHEKQHGSPQQANGPPEWGFPEAAPFHGGDRDRTDDPLLAKQALSR